MGFVSKQQTAMPSLRSRVFLFEAKLPMCEMGVKSILLAVPLILALPIAIQQRKVVSYIILD
jgi:hypothetical protein